MRSWVVGTAHFYTTASKSGATWYSLFVHVPKSQMVLELVDVVHLQVLLELVGVVHLQVLLELVDVGQGR